MHIHIKILQFGATQTNHGLLEYINQHVLCLISIKNRYIVE